MDDDPHVLQRSGDSDRIIAAGIVNEDDQVDETLFHDFVIGHLERPGRVVRGHHHDHLLAVVHLAPGCPSIGDDLLEIVRPA